MFGTVDREMPVHQGRRARGTKGQIVSLLRYSPMSVIELAEHTGIAGSTVRRHLDVLMRDGIVVQQPVKASVGRPKFLFSLTDQGSEHFPRNYAGLVTRLVSEVLLLTPDQTSKMAGNDLVETLYDNVLERLIDDYKPRITGKNLLEQAEQVSSYMYLEGIDFQVRYSTDISSDTEEIEMYGLGMTARYEDGVIERTKFLLGELLDAKVSIVETDHLPTVNILTYLITK